MDVDGAAHAEQYVTLAEGKSQGPWHQTVVKGVGYKQFPAAGRWQGLKDSKLLDTCLKL